MDYSLNIIIDEYQMNKLRINNLVLSCKLAEGLNAYQKIDFDCKFNKQFCFMNYCNDIIIRDHFCLYKERELLTELNFSRENLRKKRLYNISVAIENEHECGQKNILELQWHVSNFSRQLNILKNNIETMRLELSKLRESEEYLSQYYPLVQDKILQDISSFSNIMTELHITRDNIHSNVFLVHNIQDDLSTELDKAFKVRENILESGTLLKDTLRISQNEVIKSKEETKKQIIEIKNSKYQISNINKECKHIIQEEFDLDSFNKEIEEKISNFKNSYNELGNFTTNEQCHLEFSLQNMNQDQLSYKLKNEYICNVNNKNINLKFDVLDRTKKVNISKSQIEDNIERYKNFIMNDRNSSFNIHNQMLLLENQVSNSSYDSEKIRERYKIMSAKLFTLESEAKSDEEESNIIIIKKFKNLNKENDIISLDKVKIQIEENNFEKAKDHYSNIKESFSNRITLGKLSEKGMLSNLNETLEEYNAAEMFFKNSLSAHEQTLMFITRFNNDVSQIKSHIVIEKKRIDFEINLFKTKLLSFQSNIKFIRCNVDDRISSTKIMRSMIETKYDETVYYKSLLFKLQNFFEKELMERDILKEEHIFFDDFFDIIRIKHSKFVDKEDFNLNKGKDSFSTAIDFNYSLSKEYNDILRINMTTMIILTYCTESSYLIESILKDYKLLIEIHVKMYVGGHGQHNYASDQMHFRILQLATQEKANFQSVINIKIAILKILDKIELFFNNLKFGKLNDRLQRSQLFKCCNNKKSFNNKFQKIFLPNIHKNTII